MARINWDEVRVAFITDPHKETLKQFCGNRGISYSTASKRSAAENWEAERQSHWQKVETKATEAITELQVTVTARDVSQKLAQIHAMKMNALKYAGGIDGQEVAYEKPHEAVAAYERLEKLERLILGESTEHIKVDDARAFARDVLTIVREEVSSQDDLERIAARVTALSVGAGSHQPPHRAVH